MVAQSRKQTVARNCFPPCSVASGLDKPMLTTGYLNTELEPDFFLCQRLLRVVCRGTLRDLFHVPSPPWMTWWDTVVYLQGITPLELSKLYNLQLFWL